MVNKFMKLAIKEATEGIKQGDGGPFGAVIVKDGKVIGSGHNKVVSSNDPTCHGEIDAIRNACKSIKSFDLTDCDLYTTSAPCPMCRGAIQWANISKVYCGCTIEDAEEIGFKDVLFYKSDVKQESLDRDKCLKLFDKYKKMSHKMY